LLKPLLFLFIATCAYADTLTIVESDHIISVLTNSSRYFSAGPGHGGFLYGPAPGVYYAGTPTPYSLFAEPGDESIATGIQILFNTASPVVSEINVYQDLDLSPGKCSDVSLCTPALSGTIYRAMDINYSDGSTDTIFFEWIVTPEPASLVLLGGAVLFMLAVAKTRFRSSR
jgi:hypothetical protein